MSDLERWVHRQDQVWLTECRLLTWRDLVTVEIHQRVSFGVSVWRWYAALWIGPLVLVLGRRPLVPMERMTKEEVRILEMFRDLERDLPPPPTVTAGQAKEAAS